MGTQPAREALVVTTFRAKIALMVTTLVRSALHLQGCSVKILDGDYGGLGSAGAMKPSAGIATCAGI